MRLALPLEPVTCRFNLPDHESTARLGAALAPLLRPGDAVLLEGPLGAGKSTLVRALLRSMAQDPSLEVPSPSFTLVQTYRLRGAVFHHLDLWRLNGPGALEELGWHELVSDVVLVEWPDRLSALAPAGALHIGLSFVGDGRQAVLSGWPDRNIQLAPPGGIATP